MDPIHRLIELQGDLIDGINRLADRLDRLEQIEERLQEIADNVEENKFTMTEIRNALDWTKEASTASMILKNKSWNKKLSTADQTIKAINDVESAIQNLANR